MFQKLFIARKKNTHKNDYGKVLVIAGSVNAKRKTMIGATLLASRAALKTGAGIVHFSILKSIESLFTEKDFTSEKVLAEVPELIHYNLNYALKNLNNFDAVLIGPGIGVSRFAKKIIRKVLENYSGRLLVDADGLNNLSGHPISKKLKASVLNRQYETVLTPHIGEAKKLFGEKTYEGETYEGTAYEDEIKNAVSKNEHLVVVLKSSITKVFKKGEIKIHNKENPALATAGSGDVLAGIITALLAQKSGVIFTAFEAAYYGVYIHGMAGEFAKKEFGERSVLASDIIDNIYKCFITKGELC